MVKRRCLPLAFMAAAAAPTSAFLVRLAPPTSSGTTATSTATLLSTSTSSTRLHIQAPPNSGYFSPKDEASFLPETYEPMWEYPGTMRPGRTPENVPYQDLPIADDAPDPVPWPHFQEIEWHHQWAPPHQRATPMEDFIQQHGRWATPELEAAMRAGARRGVREQREAQEAERRGTVITDDDEEDDYESEMMIDDEPVSLGEGVFGTLGSAADQAATAAAVDPKQRNEVDDGEDGTTVSAAQKGGLFGDDSDDEVGDDTSLDDFLLDLGLDTELEDDNGSGGDDESNNSNNSAPTKSLRELESEDDTEDDIVDEGVKAIRVDDEDDLDFVDEDEEEEGSGASGGSINLDDFDDAQNGGLPDTDDIFDEGGFDFGDDGGDFGDDVW